MSQRPRDGDTGINSFMLIFIFVFFGGVVLYTIFGPQGDPVTPNAVNHTVTSNLRALATAADRYFVEHTGVSSVAYTTLVGPSPSQPLKSFTPIAGETYTPVIVKGSAITASGVSGTRTITYAP